MRLLFLTAETCPTFRADVNVLFGKYLPRHGIHSDIVSGKTSGIEGDVHWGGGESYLCDVSGGQATKHIKMLWHGARHLLSARKSRYQAIQVRDMPVLGAIGLLASRFKGLPFYYWMSFPIPEGQIALAAERGLAAGVIKFLFPWVRGRVGRFLLYRVVLPGADHVFVQSDRMKEEMADMGVDPAKMTPVPMGVDIAEVDLDRLLPADDPRLTGRRVLVYLGAQDRPRRIEVLFDMLAMLKTKVPDVLLVLVGDTEDDMHRSWLRQRAAAVGVTDHLLWTGWLGMKEGWRYVAAAEVALSPIPRGFLLDRSSPTKVPEYLAVGVPVVCSDNPDQQNLVSEGECGICVPYTARDFAAAVSELLALDQAERESMIQTGRAFVRGCRSYAHIAVRVAGTYGELVGVYKYEA